MGEWRLKNISTRYNAAGVQRFAFLNDSQSPPMTSQSAEGELFLTGFRHLTASIVCKTSIRVPKGFPARNELAASAFA